MAKYYSKTSNWFVDDAVTNPLPSDAVAVSSANYADIFSKLSNGWVLESDANGNPVASFVAGVVIPFQTTARVALEKTDVTVARCYSAGVPVPAEWQTYRNALRAIVNGTDITSTTLPATPTYPANT